MVAAWLLVSSACVVAAGRSKDSTELRMAPVSRAFHSTVVNSSDSQPHRRWFRGTWIRVGGVRNEYLLEPQLLAAFGRTIFVFDFGDQQLKAFSNGGQLLWSMGGPGAGPSEFGRPTDLQTAPNGDIWLSDAGNDRIYVIRSDGRSRRIIEMPRQTTRVMPLRSGDFLGWFSGFGDRAQRPFLARYNLQGQPLSGLLYFAELEHVSAMAAEPVVTVGRRGDGAVAFRWSGRLIALAPDGSVTARTDGIEPLPFPEIKAYKIQDPQGRRLLAFRTDPTATWAANSIIVLEDRTLVLFRGRTKWAGRILDVYALRTATYVGSMLLPRAASRIAAIGSDLVVLYGDGKPHVDVMRWRPRP